MRRRTFLQFLGLAPAIPAAAKLPTLAPAAAPLDLDAILAACYEVRRNRDYWSVIYPTPSYWRLKVNADGEITGMVSDMP